ncbi:MAG: type I-C CRISPR-associated protein Cas7/Csd2 [Proteobacteria bacterium]|nr:type I-C CRISPR-associated protein Cas7/Csd2 [Desulfobacteraceae bacterium]MBU4013816.1 type I-C CRISPR-associated protein Cas7/Csd2 [Pseudomonadota bacterium]MBU4067803.1 type I-C CRISPR-associated protein Cas7/Csd2 [Pseudomonadota bacterium]MBU4100119.1 type I-C CRISPR-associated protein Cas7/Csd2 [Pseudomonadota bacterium]MBU4128033.1 type I-C CRISPR-associated protein Cas7/Csd2 [Pseudomonadota bacterium]
MSNTIQNRYEFVYLFDVENGNPNGDPDAGNMPRIDPETSYGLVTDVCLKRKIRNFVEIVKGNQSPYKIYIREKAVLSSVRKPAYEEVKKEAGNNEAKTIELAREWMCRNFFDVRTFGAVMSTKENNCGQVRGPVQLNFARSIDSIVPMEVTITRMAVETEKEAKQQSGDNRTMGRKHIVPYALYRAEGYISAHLAAQTGFSEENLELLWESLINMFDHDHSAARGKMNARKLIVFKHSSMLGNAPAHKLFDLVTVKRATDITKPARAFSDYDLKIDKSNVPQGVTLEEKI